MAEDDRVDVEGGGEHDENLITPGCGSYHSIRIDATYILKPVRA